MHDLGLPTIRNNIRHRRVSVTEDQTRFGTLVFFDDLKHIGIINDASSFYHAQVSFGTNRSPMNSFWRQKIYGYRKVPMPGL